MNYFTPMKLKCNQFELFYEISKKKSKSYLDWWTFISNGSYKSKKNSISVLFLP